MKAQEGAAEPERIRCAWKACRAWGLYQPIVALCSGSKAETPAALMLPAAYCERCRARVTVADVLDQALLERATRALTQIGRRAPDRALCSLSWTAKPCP